MMDAPGKQCPIPTTSPALHHAGQALLPAAASARPSVGIATAIPSALKQPQQVFHKAALKLD